jgi:hypothetical protein
MWSSGFKIEKLGLLSLRHPWLSLLVVALTTPLMVYGASKLEFSSDIRGIFRSAGDEFERLDTVEERFPGHSHQVEIVIDSDETFSPQELEALQPLRREKAALLYPQDCALDHCRQCDRVCSGLGRTCWTGAAAQDLKFRSHLSITHYRKQQCSARDVPAARADHQRALTLRPSSASPSRRMIS